MDFQIGDIVKSCAGHDKNELFVIISIDKKGFFDIIDGRHHTLKNPKKKNPKHLIRLVENSNVIDLLGKATDKEIYKAIKASIIKE